MLLLPDVISKIPQKHVSRHATTPQGKPLPHRRNAKGRCTDSATAVNLVSLQGRGELPMHLYEASEGYFCPPLPPSCQVVLDTAPPPE